MDEFCPLCRKNGCNNKVIPVQLNFHEAVYLCESETCHWPYGYEEFKIIPRSISEIGKIPRKKSNIKPEIQTTKDGTQIIPISTELSLYTPPVTPSNDTTTSKEIIDSATSSVLHDIFNSTTDNHSDHLINSENPIKPSGDLHVSINNRTKTVTSPVIGIKSENIPPKISSIFDIDNCSDILSEKIIPGSSIKTLDRNDVENHDEKNNISMELTNKCSQIQSDELLSLKADTVDVKPRKKIKKNLFKSKLGLTSGKKSDPLDMKFDRKVVIFKEKSSNLISTSEDTNINYSIETKRPLPSYDDNNCQKIVAEQLPKKISKVSWDEEHNNEHGVISEFTNELCMKTPMPTIKSCSDDLLINNSVGNQLSLLHNSERHNCPVDSKESVIDQLNLDNFIEENFLVDCPNSTQEIDEEWLQSFLM